jgi:hypothetical protein
LQAVRHLPVVEHIAYRKRWKRDGKRVCRWVGGRRADAMQHVGATKTPIIGNRKTTVCPRIQNRSPRFF